MSDTDPRLISGERIVFTTRKHWAALFVNSVWAIAMVLGSLLLAWIQPGSETGILGFFNRTIELIRLGLFLGGCGWIVYNVIAWRTAEYSVTNRRVLGQEGLLRRRTTDTLLTSVSDIRTVTSMIGGLLNYGNVRLFSAAGDSGKDRLTAIRDAGTFKNQVLEQKAGRAAVVEAGATASTGSTASVDVVLVISQLLGNLASLRDAGVLTAAEYEAQKADWLRRI